MSFLSQTAVFILAWNQIKFRGEHEGICNTGSTNWATMTHKLQGRENCAQLFSLSLMLLPHKLVIQTRISTALYPRLWISLSRTSQHGTTSRKPLDIDKHMHYTCTCLWSARPVVTSLHCKQSLGLLSLVATLAERSLSWSNDNSNRATPAFPYSSIICQTGGDAESGLLTNSHSTIKKILLSLHSGLCNYCMGDINRLAPASVSGPNTRRAPVFYHNEYDRNLSTIKTLCCLKSRPETAQNWHRQREIFWSCLIWLKGEIL